MAEYFFFTSEKDLKLSKDTTNKGIESGLLYITLTKSGEAIARLSVDETDDDESQILCEMLLNGNYIAKQKENDSNVIECYCATFTFKENKKESLAILAKAFVKGYVGFYIPHYSDQKTLKNFLDIAGITPDNFTKAEFEKMSENCWTLPRVLEEENYDFRSP